MIRTFFQTLSSIFLSQNYKIYQQTLLMSFLFACCKSVQSKQGYQVRRKNKRDQKIPFTNSIDEIPKQLSKNDLASENFHVLKIQKSQYDELIESFKGKKDKWVDPTFPPDEQSLGAIPGLKKNNTWKRLSDLLNKPTLFQGSIEPKDVIQGSVDDCYFLSALASLAQRQQFIRAAFQDQSYNPNGIYKVTLRIGGQIRQIIVDDFVPVNSQGQPLFCQPNKNQIWSLILEKAWAKVHNSYANIVAGTPCQIFKAVTYAPTQSFSIKSNQQQNQKLWKTIVANIKRRYVSCCSTIQQQEQDWENIGLQEGHTYTLMCAAELMGKNGKTYKVLQLRNPWGVAQWKGKASIEDKDFWSGIQQSEQKQSFLKHFQVGNNGVFFITYKDFCKYFSQVHFCLLEQNANYISQKLFSNKKNGSVYSFNIEKPGTYTFELHQSTDKSEGLGGHHIQSEVCRSTLLLIRVEGDENLSYQFIDGVLRYSDHDTALKAKLNPGKYLLYAKIDPSQQKDMMPQKTIVSVYSTNFITLNPSSQVKYPNFLKKMFMNHARLNKRQTYNNELMWIAWKLLYQQGGYAYLAFGNHPDSNKKFVITFDQEEFDNLHFKLKKNFKRGGNGQMFQVLPGQQQIILCRVKNMTFKGLKFPPRIGIKLQYVNPDNKSVQHHQQTN